MAQIKKKLGAWLPFASAALFLLLMFAAADSAEEPEIIFPEMAALVIGAWIAKSQPWQVNRPRMVILLSLSALAGLLFSRYLPEVFLLQSSIAFLFALGLLFFSKTTFFPLLSACVLPVLLHTKSFIYPVSVFIMVTLTAVIQWGLERAGLRMAKEYTPVPYHWSAFLQRLPFLLVVFLLPAIAAQYTKLPFLIAPPLLVLLLEASSRDSRLRQTPFRVILMVLAVSVLGTAGRLFLLDFLGWSLTLAGGVVILAMLALLYGSGLLIPPVGALGLLPFLIPSQGAIFYPLCTTITAAFFLTAACKLPLALTEPPLFCRKNKKCQ